MNKRLVKKTNGCCNVTQSLIVHMFIHSVPDILILLFVRYLDSHFDISSFTAYLVF